MQPRLFDGDLLHTINRSRFRDPEHRAGQPFSHQLFITGSAWRKSTPSLVELPDLLFQRHLLEQRIGPLLRSWWRRWCRRLRPRYGLRCSYNNESQKIEQEQSNSITSGRELHVVPSRSSSLDHASDSPPC